MSGAYYNENDPKAAAWLRELIKAGHIAAGDVDERSICDVKPEDLSGYTQCHFFAGIGGWPQALRLARWADDRAVWTGSCPCQPFSLGGGQEGTEDHRDLWPVFFRLISDASPAIIFGEQVTDAIRWGWLDRLCEDLEGRDYAIGAAVLPADVIDTLHVRNRLWWAAERGRKVHCLAINGDGNPQHPLYVRDSTQPIAWFDPNPKESA